MAKQLRRFINRLKFLFKTNWNIGNTIIEIRDISDNHPCPLDNNIKEYKYISNNEDKFVCIRDIRGTCLYIPSDKTDIIFNDPFFYYKPSKLLNLTHIRIYTINRNIKAKVYNKINPPEVKLLTTESVVIGGYEMYIISIKDLYHNDDLYNDLVNYHRIEDSDVSN